MNLIYLSKILIDYQYNIFKQKEIARSFEKNVFKVVTSVNILSNTQIFNSYFVDKIKYSGTNKVYKKSWLVVQAYNNQEKDYILIQLSTI